MILLLGYPVSWAVIIKLLGTNIWYMYAPFLEILSPYKFMFGVHFFLCRSFKTSYFYTATDMTSWEHLKTCPLLTYADWFNRLHWLAKNIWSIYLLLDKLLSMDNKMFLMFSMHYHRYFKSLHFFTNLNEFNSDGDVLLMPTRKKNWYIFIMLWWHFSFNS